MEKNSPETQSFASQPWLVEFLRNAGFEPSAPDAFSNGKATLMFEGTAFTANPGHGSRAWSGNLKDADPAAAKMMLQQILKMPEFRSETDLAKERVAKERLERALAGIAETMRQGPETGSGLQLRRFLWALYNEHHLVNLWRMTCALDEQRGAWAGEVFGAAMSGNISEADIKRTLTAAGEMERWDTLRPSMPGFELLEMAMRAVESALQGIPPCRAHMELKQAREHLLDARAAIRRAKESAAG